jgi:acetyl esterase/lipase
MLLLYSLLTCQGVDPNDPQISPVTANDEILQQFPRYVTIASSGLDPLLDDGIKMVKRFEQLNLPIRHKVGNRG